VKRSFLYNLFTEARFSHAKKYLVKQLLYRPNQYETFVLAKDRKRALNIWALRQVNKRIAHVEGDLYLWNFNDEKWLGNLDHIYGLYEYLQGSFDNFYACDCREKVVLDIGGYIGDSARYFLKQGAAKVVVYEPVPLNVRCCQENLAGLPVEIIPHGVSEKGERFTISSNYPAGHIGFGSAGDSYHLEVESTTFQSILGKGSFDIAKVDCEGNEKYLLNLTSDELSKVAHWIIEIHDSALVKPLQDHFAKAGFVSEAKAVEQGHLPVFHFKAN